MDLLEMSKKMLKIKSLSFQLQFIQGLRKAVVFIFLSIIFCVLWVQGVFVIFTHLLNQIDKNGFIQFDSVLLFGIVTFVLSSLGLYWCLSQKRWLEAFGLVNVFKALMARPGEKASPTAKADGQKKELKTSDLINLIDKIVDAKVQVRIQEQLASFPTTAPTISATPATSVESTPATSPSDMTHH